MCGMYQKLTSCASDSDDQAAANSGAFATAFLKCAIAEGRSWRWRNSSRPLRYSSYAAGSIGARAGTGGLSGWRSSRRSVVHDRALSRRTPQRDCAADDGQFVLRSRDRVYRCRRCLCRGADLWRGFQSSGWHRADPRLGGARQQRCTLPPVAIPAGTVRRRRSRSRGVPRPTACRGHAAGGPGGSRRLGRDGTKLTPEDSVETSNNAARARGSFSSAARQREKGKTRSSDVLTLRRSSLGDHQAHGHPLGWSAIRPVSTGPVMKTPVRDLQNFSPTD